MITTQVAGNYETEAGERRHIPPVNIRNVKARVPSLTRTRTWYSAKVETARVGVERKMHVY